MRFREGMLGITVVMVAIAVGLLGGWALSTDVIQTEKTVYNELTEITPLFGSENAPQYTTYNPSSNYTGYYNDDSTVNDHHYFGGVEYTQSARANQYFLDLPPESSLADTTFSLENTESDSSFSLGTWYWSSTNNPQHTVSVKHLTVDALIEELALDSYTRVIIKNTAQPSDWSLADSFVTFALLSDMESIGVLGDKVIYLKNPSLTGELRSGTNRLASETPDVIMAAEYDQRFGLVTLYRDVSMTDPIGQYDPQSVCILWGGNADLFNNFYWGDTIEYSADMFPQKTYLDPAKGVELE